MIVDVGPDSYVEGWTSTAPSSSSSPASHANEDGVTSALLNRTIASTGTVFLQAASFAASSVLTAAGSVAIKAADNYAAFVPPQPPSNINSIAFLAGSSAHQREVLAPAPPLPSQFEHFGQDRWAVEEAASSPSVFLQKQLQHKQEWKAYPLRDPFDTSAKTVCEKVLWFVILQIPLVLGVFISIFVVGCPSCCKCCCFNDFADEDSDWEGDESGEELELAGEGGGSTMTSRNKKSRRSTVLRERIEDLNAPPDEVESALPVIQDPQTGELLVSRTNASGRITYMRSGTNDLATLKTQASQARSGNASAQVAGDEVASTSVAAAPVTTSKHANVVSARRSTISGTAAPGGESSAAGGPQTTTPMSQMKSILMSRASVTPYAVTDPRYLQNGGYTDSQTTAYPEEDGTIAPLTSTAPLQSSGQSMKSKKQGKSVAIASQASERYIQVPSPGDYPMSAPQSAKSSVNKSTASSSRSGRKKQPEGEANESDDMNLLSELERLAQENPAEQGAPVSGIPSASTVPGLSLAAAPASQLLISGQSDHTDSLRQQHKNDNMYVAEPESQQNQSLAEKYVGKKEKSSENHMGQYSFRVLPGTLSPDEQGRCCQILPRRTCCPCLWMNVAIWVTVVLAQKWIEFMYQNFHVLNQNWEQNAKTKVVIVSSAGGSGHIVAANKLLEDLTKKTVPVGTAAGAASALEVNRMSAGNEGNKNVAAAEGAAPATEPLRSRMANWLFSRGGEQGEREEEDPQLPPEFIPIQGQGTKKQDEEEPVESSEDVERGQKGQQDELHAAPKEKAELRPKGWAPYPGVAPLRLQKDEVDVIYSLPPECKTDPKTGEPILTKECRRRSWMQWPLGWNPMPDSFIVQNIWELVMNRVTLDVGVEVGRDRWDEAQTNGDMDVLHELIRSKDAGENMFGPTFRSAIKQYLERHPNVETVVAVMPVGTFYMYEAVVAENEQRAKLRKIGQKLISEGYAVEKLEQQGMLKKPVHFVIMLTDPPSDFNFFLRGIQKWQTEMYPSQRGYYHLDMPHGGGPYQGVLGKAGGASAQYKGDRAFYQNLLLTEPAVDTMRMGDGVLRPEFQALADRVGRGDYDPKVERTKAMSLKGVKNVNGEHEKTTDIEIGENESVVAIMLGGKAAVGPTLAYVRQSALRSIHTDKLKGETRLTNLCQKKTIFVFCGGNASLVKAVQAEAARVKAMSGPGPAEFRSELRVFALGMQGADAIAPIYARANLIVLRGGGVSAFETRAAGLGALVIIHSERKITTAAGVQRRAEKYDAFSTNPEDWEDVPGTGRVCTGGMLPHELGNAGWLSETLSEVVLCDLKVCEKVKPNPETGRCTLSWNKDKENGKDYPCLAEQDAAFKIDYAAVNDTDSLGC